MEIEKYFFNLKTWKSSETIVKGTGWSVVTDWSEVRSR